MRIGYADRLDQAEALREIGYDYLEARLTEFDLMSAEGTARGVERARRIVADVIPIAVLQSFFPKGLHVTGPERDDPETIKTYLGRAAEIAAATGAEAAVCGAAWSRNLPEGYDRSRAFDELVEAYGWIGEAFAGTRCVVGVEPQNIKECNFIRHVAEAVGVAAAVDHPNLKVAPDFYHLDEEDEDLAVLSRYGDWICHVQGADTGRREPGTGRYDYARFAAELASAGYDRTFSVEIMHDISDAEKAAALRFLRGIWPTA